MPPGGKYRFAGWWFPPRWYWVRTPLWLNNPFAHAAGGVVFSLILLAAGADMQGRIVGAVAIGALREELQMEFTPLETNVNTALWDILFYYIGALFVEVILAVVR
jgi:hypothetical protein